MNDPDSNSSVSHLLQPGDHIGAYRIERHLGRGGMADVYYAVHEELLRPSAIKVLRPSLASDEIHLQRFLQEARAAASLIHPNIVQVYDVGQDNDRRYIAQEYIPGANLRQYLTHGKEAYQENSTLPLDRQSGSSGGADMPVGKRPSQADRQLEIPETLSIVLQVLAALNKSASSGIVHRDIKPENIMLTKEGDVKVADFGLARVLLSDDPQLTRAGTTLGTPMYMSPEQIQDGLVDVRSDLYSLGVTIYHMLSGRPPFTGETPLALAMQHVQAQVPDIQQYRSDLPETIKKLVEVLLKKNPSDRFSDPNAVLDFLKQHRLGDLADYWPDQTVPLPGIYQISSAGPSHATLALQRRINNRLAVRRRQWLTLAMAMLLAIGMFAAGAWAFLPTLDLLELDVDSNIDIPIESTAAQQYLSILLGPADPETMEQRWESIPANFSASSEQNRLYFGFAWLQSARTLKKTGAYEEALSKIHLILHHEPKMEDLLLTAAWIEKACIQQANNDKASEESLREAKQLNDQLTNSDAKQIDHLLNSNSIPASIRDRWQEL
ncbi:MAG: serine/threonine protein kinase [Planctomycetales bacterium]|nr:serine/threonine protein kinase [Planctomycetales bacterium]